VSEDPFTIVGVGVVKAGAYGCDRCGRSPDEHIPRENSDLPPKCPEPHRHGALRIQQWFDDGHTVNVKLRYGGLRPIVTCPGREGGCKAGMGCHDCEGRGSNYDDEGDEVPCKTCDETGRDPNGGCWLEYMVGEFGTEFWEWTSFMPEVGLPVEILWWSSGGFEDAELEWRPKVQA
jgi:hypothetical protein